MNAPTAKIRAMAAKATESLRLQRRGRVMGSDGRMVPRIWEGRAAGATFAQQKRDGAKRPVPGSKISWPC